MSPTISSFMERNWLAILLFALSLFVPEIRRFLSSLKNRSGNVFRWFRYNSAKNRLEEVRYLNENAYRVILHITTEVMTLTAFGVALFFSLYYKHPNLFAFFFAMFTNRFARLYRLLLRLQAYDHSVKSLERVMQKNAPIQKAVVSGAEK